MTQKNFSPDGFKIVMGMMKDFEYTAKRACCGGNWGIADCAVEAAFYLADAWAEVPGFVHCHSWLRWRADRLYAHVRGQKEQA